MSPRSALAALLPIATLNILIVPPHGPRAAVHSGTKTRKVLQRSKRPPLPFASVCTVARRVAYLGPASCEAAPMPPGVAYRPLRCRSLASASGQLNQPFCLAAAARAFLITGSIRKSVAAANLTPRNNVQWTPSMHHGSVGCARNISVRLARGSCLWRRVQTNTSQ